MRRHQISYNSHVVSLDTFTKFISRMGTWNSVAMLLICDLQMARSGTEIGFNFNYRGSGVQ